MNIPYVTFLLYASSRPGFLQTIFRLLFTAGLTVKQKKRKTRAMTSVGSANHQGSLSLYVPPSAMFFFFSPLFCNWAQTYVLLLTSI